MDYVTFWGYAMLNAAKPFTRIKAWGTWMLFLTLLAGASAVIPKYVESVGEWLKKNDNIITNWRLVQVCLSEVGKML